MTLLGFIFICIILLSLIVYSHEGGDENLKAPLSQETIVYSEINTGRVFMPDGQVFDKAYEGQLIIQLRTTTGSEITETSCKEDGRYTLDLSEVEDGTYHLRMVKSYEDGLASQPEKKVKVQDHQIDSQELALKLQAPQLTGHLIDKEGTTYNQGISIFMEQGSQLVFLSNLDKEGTYYVGGLKTGSYDLLLHAHDGGLNKHVVVQISDKETHFDIYLED